MTFGANVWQLSRKDRKKIETAEMHFLRRGCRVSSMEHIRNEEIRRRTNNVYSIVDS